MLLILALVLHISLAFCQDYELVWEDDFNTLDLNKWDYEIHAWGAGNGEFQVYTQDPENVYVKEGKLYIKPTLLVNNINPLTGKPFGEEFLKSGVLDIKAMYGRCTQSEDWGCLREGKYGNIPITMSGRLRSKDRFAFKFGRIDFIANLPTGDWLWPALWMLPENWRYGNWPKSGEIDIMESLGNRDAKDAEGNWAGIQRVSSALHWGITGSENKMHLTGGHRYNVTNNYGDNFHNFSMNWSETGIRVYYDDALVMQVPDPSIDNNPSWKGFYEFGKPWNPPATNVWENGTNMTPFDDPFHILMNVAVGGTNGYIRDGLINHGGRFPKPYNNTMSQVEALKATWAKKDDWYWTWEREGENVALQVDSVRVWQRK